MTRLLLIILILFFGCGGRLSDEQRKKLKDQMELNTIKKVSDAQLTESAFAMGRKFADVVEHYPIDNRRFIDSLEKSFGVKILRLQTGDSLLLDMERQIVEAYTAGDNQNSLPDNIQRLGADSLLYTRPVMKKGADGSLEFSYAMGIHLSRKQVVLSIP